MILIGSITQGNFKDKLLCIKNNKPALAISIFIIWIYASSFWTAGNETTFRYALNTHWKLLLIPLVVILISEDKWIRYCFLGFSTGMVVLITHIYLLYFINIPWTSGRADGVFFNPLPQAVGLAIFSSWCLTEFFLCKNKLKSSLLIFLFTLSGYAILNIGQQRLGYLTLIVGCLTILFVNIEKNKRIVLITGFAVLIISIFAFNGKAQQRISLGINDVQGYIFSDNPYTSIGARLHMWNSSLSAISDSPLIGHGIGSYPIVIEKVFDDAKMCSIGCLHPHNQYIFYLLEFGIIGFLIFFTFLATTIFQTKLYNKKTSLSTAVLLIFIVSGFFESTLWYRGFFYLFAPLIALVIIQNSKLKLSNSIKN